MRLTGPGFRTLLIVPIVDPVPRVIAYSTLTRTAEAVAVGPRIIRIDEGRGRYNVIQTGRGKI